MSGCTSLSRRVRIPTAFLGQLEGLRQLPPEMARKASIVGRVEGSTLEWKLETRDYIKVPFGISSQGESWEPFSQLFAAPVSGKQVKDGMSPKSNLGNKARHD